MIKKTLSQECISCLFRGTVVKLTACKLGHTPPAWCGPFVRRVPCILKRVMEADGLHVCQRDLLLRAGRTPFNGGLGET